MFMRVHLLDKCALMEVFIRSSRWCGARALGSCHMPSFIGALLDTVGDVAIDVDVAAIQEAVLVIKCRNNRVREDDHGGAGE